MKKYIYAILMVCLFSVAAMAQTNLQHRPDGTQYAIFTPNTGDKIKMNDVVTYNVIYKTDKDSVLGSSYVSGQPAKFQVQAPDAVKDPVLARIMEIMPFAALSDSLLIKVPVDSLIKGDESKRPPIFPKGSHINVYVKVMRIQSLDDAIAERNTELAKITAAEVVAENKYAADNKLTITTTASGLKYDITKLGLKPKPQNGDTVFVNYTGKLLNGKVFDSSVQAVAIKAGLNQPGRTYEPINLVLGDHHVISGWEEALLLVNEGGKATFIIPSNLGYGEQGMGDAIPPFSTLVFDLEVTAVKRVKHAPVVHKPVTPAKAPVKHHTPVKH